MLDEELVSVFSSIVETLFEAELSPMRGPGALSANADSALLTGRVEYSGPFTGALSATVSEPLARALTSSMMRTSPRQCTALDLADALGEIVNIAAGNLKGLLSAGCQVSLPLVHAGSARAHQARHEVLSSAQFLLFGEPIWVELTGEPPRS